MANVNIKLGYKNAAFFAANPTLVLNVGQLIYLEQTGTYKIGDGVTQLSALSFLGSTSTYTSVLKHTVKAGQAINKGQAVYVSSADGTNMIVSKASNVSEALSSKTMGLLDSTLALNGMGFVVTEGLLSGLNTLTATIGDPVWLGVDGALIYGLVSKPYAPANLVFIGIVTRVSATVGEIFVRTQNGFELKELHDIDLITNAPINNDVLTYESATSLWKNKPKFQDASIVNQWLTPPFVTKSSQTNGSGVVWFFPQLIGDTKTITEISCEVTTLFAGSNVRIALYDDDGTGLLPSNLVEDSGNLSSATTGLKSFTLSTPKLLNSNNKVYWTAIQISSNSVGIRSGTTVNYFSSASGLTAGIGARVIGQSFGAFPSSGLTSTVNTTGFNYFVHIKKSA